MAMETTPHSEASKLLEAALEQMDGIIQGARFDLPQHFENCQLNSDTEDLNNGHHQRPASTSTMSISSALRNLKLSIMNSNDFNQNIEIDEDTIVFLSKWIHDNPHLGLKGESFGSWSATNGSSSPNDNLEERLASAESEKDALQIRIDVLTEQVERQNRRLNDLEQLLTAKKELQKKTEMALERERQSRMRMESQNPHYSETIRLKNRVSELEKENIELKNICTNNRTPTYLPISPVMPLNNSRSPDNDSSPTKPKEVAFSGQDENIPIHEISNELDTSFVGSPGSSRPPRGFKKIFGKIKRSNSGGHIEENKRSLTPEFRRGGVRATTSGRLGTWDRNRSLNQESNKKPISEWNVDTICTWLECLGLGMYCHEIEKNIGTGEQLVKMTYGDLETKLNIKNNFHKKKLFLALSVRQNPNKPDPEGSLDCQWVLKWLDDIGLPQYKDNFLEARIDGRLLNSLTVEELFQLKVVNQLHHLSIKHGIKILREHDFNPSFFKRRAIPGEEINPLNVSLWTNHRVMEWLKQVDLSEYAPNLRGSGVHGALIIKETKFGDELMASLLSIPSSKTLLRRHLSIHFKELVSKEVMHEKRVAEQESHFIALTPTAKAKLKQSGQFSLKRKKSRTQLEFGEPLCPK